MIVFIVWTALGILSSLAVFAVASMAVPALPAKVVDSKLASTAYSATTMVVATAVSAVLFGYGAHTGLGLTWSDLTF